VDAELIPRVGLATQQTAEDLKFPDITITFTINKQKHRFRIQ
jgi:hypothetical protein